MFICVGSIDCVSVLVIVLYVGRLFYFVDGR